MVQSIFTANLTADKIYIDLANEPATLIHTFNIQIQNQSIYPLWFKLDVSALSSDVNAPWSMSTPATGKLGTINVGTTGWYQAIIQRTNPTVDTTDIGTMRIYVYTDSGYTTQVDYADLSVTVYMENTESFTDVTIQPFTSTDSYGWTGGTLNNDNGVEAGGYNYTSASVLATGTTTLIRNALIIPNDTKVRMTFYGLLKTWCAYAAGTDWISQIFIQVNGTTIFDTGTSTSPYFIGVTITASNTNFYTNNWLKFTIDLSAYAGQTVNIVITIGFITNYSLTYEAFLLDRVVIAGSS